jgi:hypothetical protein
MGTIDQVDGATDPQPAAGVFRPHADDGGDGVGNDIA